MIVIPKFTYAQKFKYDNHVLDALYDNNIVRSSCMFNMLVLKVVKF